MSHIKLPEFKEAVDAKCCVFCFSSISPAGFLRGSFWPTSRHVVKLSLIVVFHIKDLKVYCMYSVCLYTRTHTCVLVQWAWGIRKFVLLGNVTRENNLGKAH